MIKLMRSLLAGWLPGEDFVILEANSRVGGRMHTIDCVNSKAEKEKTMKHEGENVESEEEDSKKHSPSPSPSPPTTLLPFGIDVGAQWIHGRVGNPIYKLAFDLFELEMTRPYQGNVIDL